MFWGLGLGQQDIYQSYDSKGHCPPAICFKIQLGACRVFEPLHVDLSVLVLLVWALFVVWS